MAIAGPYANRLDAVADPICRFASVGNAINLPVPASVAPSRFRRMAMATARIPPAIAVKSKCRHDGARPDHRPHCRHQLHVPGAGGAERMTRQHEHESEREPRERRQERHAAQSRGCHPDADTRHRRGQRIRNAPSANINHCGGQRTDRQSDERRIRNCSQSRSRKPC